MQYATWINIAFKLLMLYGYVVDGYPKLYSIPYNYQFLTCSLNSSVFSRISGHFNQMKRTKILNGCSQMLLNDYLAFDQWLPRSYFLFLNHGTFQKVQGFTPEEMQTYKYSTSVNI